MRDPFSELNMGFVKTNYARIPNSDRHIWESRGFRKISDFRLSDPFRITMLGIPETVAEFGLDRIKGYKITGVMAYFGSGGIEIPGFFGIKIEKGIDVRWLIYAVWSAASCLSMDDIPVMTHDENSQKWIKYEDIEVSEYKLTELIKNSVIDGLELEKTDFRLTFTAPDGTSHKVSPRLFKPYIKGSADIKDYLLVIYDGSFLTV